MEKQKSKVKEKKNGGPQGLAAADSVQIVGSVVVIHGAHNETLPLEGMTVEQARNKFADRLDIDPKAAAFINGTPVNNEKDTILTANSVLTFSKQAGEKGAPTAVKKKHSLEIEGDSVKAISPEGITASMPLTKWLDAVATPILTTGDFILPDGIKTMQTRGKFTILVHEETPKMYDLKWIAKDSPRTHGAGTKYRQIKISLPYVLTFAVFQESGNKIHLGDDSECFFSNFPIKSLSEKNVCYPALLNVSKRPNPESYPLAWICTQFLDRSIFDSNDRNQYMRMGLKELLRTLLSSGFNLSSERHEGESWFGATVKAKVDKRIESVESWSENSIKNPLFVLDVPWLKTGLSVQGICDRIFNRVGAVAGSVVKTSDDLAKLIFLKGA